MKLNYVFKLIPLIIGSISSELREDIEKGVDQLAETASKTPNKVDDIAVQLLKIVIGK